MQSTATVYQSLKVEPLKVEPSAEIKSEIKMGLVHPSEGFLEPLEESSFEEEPPLDIEVEPSEEIKREVKVETSLEVTAHAEKFNPDVTSPTRIEPKLEILNPAGLETKSECGTTTSSLELKRESLNASSFDSKPESSLSPALETKFEIGDQTPRAETKQEVLNPHTPLFETKSEAETKLQVFNPSSSFETGLEPETEDCVQTLLSFSQTHYKGCIFSYSTPASTPSPSG